MRPVKEKKERALGTRLFLKADRCNSPKCVMVRRPSRPGMHGNRRSNKSEYGKQLQEKQKIQIYYGLSNRQMRTLFHESKSKAVSILEHRLDHVVFLLGFGRSPRIARQLVSHGHILVNGRKVTIPSFHVKVGALVAVRPESRSSKLFEDIALRMKNYTPPAWLTMNAEKLEGKCVADATSQDIQFPFDINLVGQFFAR